MKENVKVPRGFHLIGQTSKSVLRATMNAAPQKGAHAAILRRRRQFGNRSPLDRLPKKVKGELRKRCKAGDVFREIRAWLMAGNQCRTSITSLSAWWRRQQEEAGNPASAARSFRRGLLEFIVHAPGASEVRVLVKPR